MYSSTTQKGLGGGGEGIAINVWKWRGALTDSGILNRERGDFFFELRQTNETQKHRPLVEINDDVREGGVG